MEWILELNAEQSLSSLCLLVKAFVTANEMKLEQRLRPPVDLRQKPWFRMGKSVLVCTEAPRKELFCSLHGAPGVSITEHPEAISPKHSNSLSNFKFLAQVHCHLHWWSGLASHTFWFLSPAVDKLGSPRACSSEGWDRVQSVCVL